MFKCKICKSPITETEYKDNNKRCFQCSLDESKIGIEEEVLGFPIKQDFRGTEPENDGEW